MPERQNGHAETPNEVAQPMSGPRALARKVPTLEYTVQNILISFFTMWGAIFTLLFTVSVVLPVSLLRALGIIPKAVYNDTLSNDADGEPILKRGKVVLIVGASRGIGLEVFKQYVPEPDTTVIAVAKDYDQLRAVIVDLGDTPATVKMEALDLSGSSKTIAQAVARLDADYGPISHLYAISGVSSSLQTWNMDTTEKMIQSNISGIVAVVMTMYERMRTRRYGKICIVGSVAGVYSPANMISYASTKSFINTFSASLRVLASAYNIDVVTAQPGFVQTRKARGQVPGMEFASAEEMARRMKLGTEKGGVGVVSWPTRQSVAMYALKSLNPICDEFGRYVSMRFGMGGKKTA